MKTHQSIGPLKPPHKRRIWLRVLLAMIIVFVLASSAYAYKTYRSLSKVIVKNTGVVAEGLKTENINPDKLKGEGDGRVNILLMGVGDPGHEGETLSDTLIVASYDPKTHDVAMLSIPRDLYVKIGNEGYSKINNANAFGEQYKTGGGPDLTKQTVSAVLGIPIHYYVRTNFSALKQVVDTVGGVDVVVKTSLLDPEYPCSRDEGAYCGFSMLAGPQHLNGSAALKYVRCRKGNCGDDFGRAGRQQDVLVALREKADKQNILKNPVKINDLFGIIGNNVRTDLQLSEIQRLAQIVAQADPNKIVTHVLDNTTNNLVVTSDIDGASVVVPSAGVGKYSAIQAYVRSIFVDGYIKQEAATIEIANGTASASRAKLASDLLKSYNYNVVGIVPAQSTAIKTTQIIDYTNGQKPYTIQYLEKRLDIKATVGTVDPAAPPTADIRIIIGADYQTQ